MKLGKRFELIIQGIAPNNLPKITRKNMLVNNNISFTSKAPPCYKVTDKNLIKRFLPVIAFSASLVSTLGYFLGAGGLFYDLHHDKKNKTAENNNESEGVKTVVASTKIGKAGINCTKVGITAAAVANIACGMGEGLPLMALGEASNLGAAPIIETPIGTGLFGIGIASIFAGLALDNTPELKLDEFELMAKKGFINKAKLVVTNMKNTAKEIGSSVFHVIKNSYKPNFWKNDILQITPKTIVFSESINKNGQAVLTRALRHNKNYLMHTASFTLALGGIGIIISSLLKANKAQKASLKIEEGGFLFDNLGITKYGLDRLTTGNKSSGISFALGGIVNAVSQFIGLDNKDGRALQWLGIGGVFLGYTIDRGKHLRKALNQASQRPELTKIVREWKFDLSNLVSDSAELKKLLFEIKTNKPITNSNFVNFETAFKNAVGQGDIKPVNKVKDELSKNIKKDIFEKIKYPEFQKDIDDTKEILTICTKKIFGSESPTPVK